MPDLDTAELERLRARQQWLRFGGGPVANMFRSDLTIWEATRLLDALAGARARADRLQALHDARAALTDAYRVRARRAEAKVAAGLALLPTVGAAKYDADGNYEGREGGPEHRTVGSHRAWCHGCTEWCYPTTACPCCEEPIAPSDLRAALGPDQRQEGDG